MRTSAEHTLPAVGKNADEMSRKWNKLCSPSAFIPLSVQAEAFEWNEKPKNAIEALKTDRGHAKLVTARTTSSQKAIRRILSETEHSLSLLERDKLAMLGELIAGASRIFVYGVGRSGLVLRTAAMRMMHLGLTTFVVGDCTTPAINSGDLLIVASGSGSTSSVVHAAKTAKQKNAKVVVITANGDADVNRLADLVVFITAAVKEDRGQTLSMQFAGSLFEQTVFFLFESLFLLLWRLSGLSAEQLFRRHANLE